MEKMILIDLETQNFPVESGIYEVACLVIENYEVVDKLYLGQEIEGYTGSRKYGFGFYDISRDKDSINKFQEFIGKYNYPLVAHNCPFDKKFLRYYEWITEEYPTYCSMRAIRMQEKGLSSYALKNLIKHYKVGEKIEHTALSDVEDLLAVLKLVKPIKWLKVGEPNKVAYKKEKARDLEDIDLNIEKTHKLQNEVVCFTGKSDYKRNTMEEIAIMNGATIAKGVNAKTTMLVVGEKAGSKLDKAQEKEISIISDEEFMEILGLKETIIGTKVSVQSLESVLWSSLTKDERKKREDMLKFSGRERGERYEKLFNEGKEILDNFNKSSDRLVQELGFEPQERPKAKEVAKVRIKKEITSQEEIVIVTKKVIELLNREENIILKEVFCGSEIKEILEKEYFIVNFDFNKLCLMIK